MFARVVTSNLKPGTASEHAAALEREAIPLMRKFTGFRDQITLVSKDGKQSIGISLWDTAADADVYHRDGYSKVLSIIGPSIEGTPVLTTCDVAVSTAHGIRAGAAGATSR